MFWGHDQGWDSDYSGSDSFRRTGRLWACGTQTNGTEGEEPPQWVKDMYALDAARWSSVSGSEEFNKLKEDTFAWSRENLPEDHHRRAGEVSDDRGAESAQRGERRLCHCLELRRRAALV